MATALALLVPLFLLAPRQDGQAKPAHAPNLVERVVVIGASMSAGFGTAHPFADALDASLRAPHRQVATFASELFFTEPLVRGRQEIAAAQDAEATLVVGIDFLFWFGYGAQDADGRAIDREAQRLELLEKGLGYLSELDCPLVLADFPDMTASLGKMLAPEQMPKLS